MRATFAFERSSAGASASDSSKSLSAWWRSRRRYASVARSRRMVALCDGSEPLEAGGGGGAPSGGRARARAGPVRSPAPLGAAARGACRTPGLGAEARARRARSLVVRGGAVASALACAPRHRRQRRAARTRSHRASAQTRGARRPSPAGSATRAARTAQRPDRRGFGRLPGGAHGWRVGRPEAPTRSRTEHAHGTRRARRAPRRAAPTCGGGVSAPPTRCAPRRRRAPRGTRAEGAQTWRGEKSCRVAALPPASGAASRGACGGCRAAEPPRGRRAGRPAAATRAGSRPWAGATSRRGRRSRSARAARSRRTRRTRQTRRARRRDLRRHRRARRPAAAQPR